MVKHKLTEAFAPHIDDATCDTTCLQKSPKGQTALGSIRSLVYDNNPYNLGRTIVLKCHQKKLWIWFFFK